MKKLLIVIPDRLSVLINKGEVVNNYYNPGGLFDQVDIILINDDQPNLKLVQPMVGEATLTIHNLPEPSGFFKKTLGWQRRLMVSWFEKALQMAKNINPDIIRCYGAHLNLSVAVYLKETLNIPLIVSLHTHPIYDNHKTQRNIKEKIINFAAQRLYRQLNHADIILPVYQGITYYLDSLKLKTYEVIYNKVGISNEHCKTNFDYSKSFKLICIGQQVQNKNPSELIKAITYFDNVTLDIVGDGILHSNLKNLVKSLNLESKVNFIKSIPNAELCKNLKNYDAFAGNIDCIGISKVVIESFLCKLPVLLNWNSSIQVPELNKNICLRVDNTPEGYREGINKLLHDKELRLTMAEEGYAFAYRKWNPKTIESQQMEVYKKYLSI